MFSAPRSGQTEAGKRAAQTTFEVRKDPSQMLPKTLSLCQKLHFARLNGSNKVFGMCYPIKAKTGGTPLGGTPGRRPGGPRSRSTHGARCVPGTSQASAEAENDEVAIFSGACGQLSLCWSGGCAAPSTGYFFSRGRGGPAGPVCPLSVSHT